VSSPISSYNNVISREAKAAIYPILSMYPYLVEYCPNSSEEEDVIISMFAIILFTLFVGRSLST
jgi:hypothetical protein